MTSPSISIAQALDKLTLPSESVVGIGVDLVNVGMLEELLASGSSAFLDTCWTDAEQRDAENSRERLCLTMGSEGSSNEGTQTRTR